MKHQLIAALLLFNLTTIFAQNYVDILKIYTNTTPLNKFDSSASSTRVNEVGADFTYPIKLNEKNAIISGLIYEGIQARLFPNQPIKNISSICLKAGLDKIFNDTWSGTFVLLPKIASDFVDLSNKDFQIGGLASIKIKKNDHLNYRFGMYVNSDLFGPLVIPLVGLYYLSPNQKFETNMMLPLLADMNYKIVPFVNIGINFTAQIKSYHLTDITPAYSDTYLTKATDELCAYLKFNFTKSLSLQTRFGQSFGRNYRVFNENDKVTLGLPGFYVGDNRHQLNTDFSNGLLFQLVLIYRVYL